MPKTDEVQQPRTITDTSVALLAMTFDTDGGTRERLGATASHSTGGSRRAGEPGRVHHDRLPWRGASSGSNIAFLTHWSNPLCFSDLGKEISREILTSNRRVKPNEVKLAVFFHVGCPDGLLIEPNTEVAALRHGISTEMRSQRILFPYIYGRDLHDLAATQYPEKTHLSNSESIALLRQLPQGVFQEGKTVVGPLGAIVSDCYRSILSRLAVPGYLCSDETCSGVHSIQLQTALSAIQRSRRIVSEYVDQHHGGTDDEHARIIQEATSLHYDPRRAARRKVCLILWLTLLPNRNSER